MLEVIVGVLTLLAVLVSVYVLHVRTQSLAASISGEADMMRENMNHIAAALVGVSELLDDADDIVASVASIPSPGEMLMQMIQTVIMQKIAPTLSQIEIPPVISDNILPATYGETESTQNETPKP